MVKVSSLRRVLRLGGGFTACLLAVTLLFVNARLADAQALARFFDEGRVFVGVGVDGDGGDAEAARRAVDASSDLAAVGDQELLREGHGRRLQPPAAADNR